MATGHANNSAKAIRNLLQRIGRGENPKNICKEANELIKDIDPKDIVTAEQNLIQEGYSARTVHQLSAAFMFIGMHQDHEPTGDNKLPVNHILRKIALEHDMIRCCLADLEDLVEEISNIEQLTDVSSEFRRLVHIVGHLNVMKEHIDREEHVIFPYFRKHGWDGLCRAAQQDHINIGIELDNLVRLTCSINSAKPEQFNAWLSAIAGRLIPVVLEHIWYEDDILHPMGLAVINNEEVWGSIKAICEDIGYCGIHH